MLLNPAENGGCAGKRFKRPAMGFKRGFGEPFARVFVGRFNHPIQIGRHRIPAGFQQWFDGFPEGFDIQPLPLQKTRSAVRCQGVIKIENNGNNWLHDCMFKSGLIQITTSDTTCPS